MKLEYAILAEAAEVTQTHKLAMLGGNVEVFNAAVFPAMIPALTLVISIKVAPEECNRAHTARLDLLDPDGANVLANAGFQFTPRPNPPELSEFPVRYVSLINLNGLQLPSPGTYTFRFSVDGDEKAQVLVLAAQKGAAAAPASRVG